MTSPFEDWFRQLHRDSQWSHCHNPLPHEAHEHRIVFNEGPYDVVCCGTPSFMDLIQAPSPPKLPDLDIPHINKEQEVKQQALELMVKIWYRNADLRVRRSPEGFCEEFVEELHNANLLRKSIDS